MEEILNQTHEPPCPTDPSGDCPFQPIEYYQPPRLGIIHLLAWATVAVVLLKLNQSLEMLSAASGTLRLNDTYLLGVKSLTAALMVVNAALFVGGFVFWRDRWYRKPGVLQPGHWIVAIESAFYLASEIERAILFSTSLANNVRFLQTGYIWCQVCERLLWVSLLTFAAWRLSEKGRWKWAFVFRAAQGVLTVLLLLYACAGSFISLRIDIFRQFMVVIPYSSCFVSGLFLIAMVIDFAKGMRRDWLHWLGVLFPLASLAIGLASALVAHFFPPLAK